MSDGFVRTYKTLGGETRAVPEDNTPPKPQQHYLLGAYECAWDDPLTDCQRCEGGCTIPAEFRDPDSDYDCPECGNTGLEAIRRLIGAGRR